MNNAEVEPWWISLLEILTMQMDIMLEINGQIFFIFFRELNIELYFVVHKIPVM